MHTQPLRVMAVGVLVSLATGCPTTDIHIDQVDGRLVVSPGMVDLHAVAVGSHNEFTVQLTGAAGVVKVLAVDVQNVDGTYFSVVPSEDGTFPTLEKDQEATLTFAYDPPVEGWHWANVTIATDEPEGSPHLVDVRAEAATATAWVSPTILDFGPVLVGEAPVGVITVENTCSLDLELVSIEGLAAPFSLETPLPAALLGGQAIDLEVVFAPQDQEEVTADLSLTMDVPVALSTVTVRGNACSTASGDLYDQDGDGYGFCGGDCDDRDASSHPGAEELVDGVDNDCDGLVDDGTSAYDDDGDGFSEDAGDCNDNDPAISPGLDEVQDNGIDDDCDGQVDSGENDRDGDGYGIVGGDCDDDDPTRSPATVEVANGIDDDCDGTIDEGTEVWDDDGDGYSESGGDCDDTDASIYPGAPEQENWIDDDCDGDVDDGTDHADDDGDGFSEIGGDCDDADSTVNPGAYDPAGDGADDDCDGIDG